VVEDGAVASVILEAIPWRDLVVAHADFIQSYDVKMHRETFIYEDL